MDKLKLLTDYPSTLEGFRRNAQITANLEQRTYYIYESLDPEAEGFDRWCFTHRDDYDDAHPTSFRFVEAVDPNP